MAPTLDKNLLLGSILVSSWVNASLYTLELLLAWKYWRSSKDDSRLNRATVVGVVLADTVCSFANFYSLYFYCITSFGQVAALLNTHISVPIDVAMTGVSGALVEGFLSDRIYRLMGTSDWPQFARYGVAGFLFAVNLVSFASCIVAAVILGIYPTLADRCKIITPLTIWLSTAAGLDTMIAISLVYLFWTVKRRGKDLPPTRTDSIIRRLSRAAVASGAVPALAAIVALLCFHWTTETLNMSTAFGFVTGRLYALSLLGNLVMRNSSMGDTGNRGMVQTIDCPSLEERGMSRHVGGPIVVTQSSRIEVEVGEDGDIETESKRGSQKYWSQSPPSQRPTLLFHNEEVLR